MKFGLQLPFFDWPGGTTGLASKLAEIAKTAEQVGFNSLWVMDHFFQMEAFAPASDPMLEGYSTLGYLAALTERVKLGLLVTGVIYRHPGILVKTATTVDVLSGGRLYFGIGAAWYEREAKGLGVPFPPIKERFEQLEETLQITKQMWSDDNSAYHGQHFQLAETLCQPQPLSEPHPPIMIGGGGEKKTLRMVAQYADACNLTTNLGVDGLKHKLDVLRQHCDAVGRNYDDIEKTVIHHIADLSDVNAVRDQFKALQDIGIDHIIMNMPDAHTITPLKKIGADIMPPLR